MTYLRETNVQKSHRIILMILVFVLGVWIRPQSTLGEERNVVKVGYADVPGFTEIEQGQYTGYAYEYLTEMAKYTGWEYEFIEMSLNDLIYQLRDGEIDLAAGMLRNKQTEEMYDFPRENAGYTYTTLSVLKDNDAISSSNYETFQGIKVGYYQTSQTRLKHFLKFCEENKIEGVQLVEYPYNEDKTLLEALEAGEVDAVINGDLLVEEGQKVVAKFEPMPYYFATTKGNEKILEGLNKALFKIREENPHFDQELYTKYFKNHIDYSVHLTQKEQDYINEMEPLKVVYIDEFPPMQDYNEETNEAEGIYVDMMALIARRSGLRYELVKAANYEEAFEMIQAKKVDLILAATNSYLIATQYEYSLTQGYFDVNVVKVFDVNKAMQEDKQIVALPKGYAFAKLEHEYEVRYYETVEDCLEAVKTGEATLTYGNGYTISKYLTTGYYPNLSTIYDQVPVQATIGIAKPVNVTLLDIINKAVASISENETREIVYNNTLNVKDPVTFGQFFYDNLALCTYVITGIVIVVMLVESNYKRLKKDKHFLLRKSQTDALTGVYNRAAGIELVTKYFKNKEDVVHSAIAIMDIDYFKQVNDHLGHHIGDELLIEFSRLLKSVFTPQDIIFRLGGDEFVIFMTNLRANRLQRVHEKLQEIHEMMNKEISYKGQSQKISLSIGAIITKQIGEFDQLYKAADEILYEVKRSGRNGFKIKEID